ncbi:MAG: integral membrane protein [Planctomycetota bacterium]|jgi:integral membrane protein
MLRYDTPTAHLRSLAVLEGWSYLTLLFVAMPLKYLAEQPLPVRLVGSLHGLLFTWLMLLLLQGMRAHGRSFGWAFRIGIASLIPFGMMFVDKSLQREDEEYRRDRSLE